MKKSLPLIFLAISQAGMANTYNVIDQSGFDSALTTSAGSTTDNIINVNAPGSVSIASATTISGNPPHTLTLNVNDNASVNVTAPLTVNSQGAVIVQDGGTFALNGGILKIGGENSLLVPGTGTFSLGATTPEGIQVIGSDLTLNLPIDMSGTPTSSGVAALDTNGFNATLSGTLTTANNTGGIPIFSKVGTGNLTLKNFSMTGGGECFLTQGTADVREAASFTYLSVGHNPGANATLNLSNSDANLTIQQPAPGNQSSAIQIGDFTGTAQVNHSAGILNVIDASFNLSNQGGNGTYNLSGGTLNFTGVSTTSFLDIGRNAGSNPASTGILNISGTGMLNVYSSGANAHMIIGSRSTPATSFSNGIVNQSGGLLRISNGADLFLASYGDGTYNLTGGALEIGGAALNPVYLGSGTYAFNLGGDGKIRVIGSDLTSSVDITLLSEGNGSLDTNGFNATLSGDLTGPGAFTKAGIGQLTLSGTNSYSGGTTVSAGVLTGDSTSLQGDILNNGSVVFNQSTPGSYLGNMSGTGSLIKESSASLILSGANSYSGGTTVSAGLLQGTTTSLQGDILNNGSVTFAQTTDGTYAGNMSGTGGLTKTGAGTMVLSGKNSYSGGTTITAGALEGNSSSLQGAIAVVDNTLTFHQSVPDRFNGTLTGTSLAILNKTGPSTLTFHTDQSAFLGTTNITQGKLALNNILGGDVNVSETGILSGIGRVLGHVNVDLGGTVAPGNSPGTLTIDGSYTQGPSSTYFVTVGNRESSRITTPSTATLAGILGVQLTNGANLNTTYNILHADGEVTGKFSDVITFAALIPKITYTETDVFLTFKTNFSSIASTRNQKTVARQLDSITAPDNTQQTVLNELALISQDPSSSGEALRRLDLLSGMQFTNSFVLAELSNQRFTSNIYDALRANILPVSCVDDEWCTWLAFDGGRSFFDGDQEAYGFRATQFSAVGGIQKQWGSRWTIGAAASYEHEKIYHHLSGHNRNHIGSGALYGLYRPKHFYVWGDVAFGWTQQHMKRTIDVGSVHLVANSNPHIQQGSAYFEAGTDLFWNSFVVQPFIGFQAGYFIFDRMQESGADSFNLDFSSKSRANAHSDLGFHIILPRHKSGINFYADLFWQYRLTNLPHTLSGSFATFGTPFTIVGAHLSRNSIYGALTASKQFTDHLTCYIEANGQKWPHASSYRFIGGLQYCW